MIKKSVLLSMLVLLFCITDTAFAQAPNAPTGLNASQIGIKDFKLSWIASPSAGITGYEVFKDGISFGTTTAAVTNLKIAGLTFGTAYTMTVQAKNATTSSASSSSLVVNTFPALQVNTATGAPVIDGNVDALWANAVTYTAANITRGTVTNDEDLSGTFRLLADNNKLYLLAEVKDDIAKTNSMTEAWQNDGIEMYLDIGWQAPNSYGTTDFQFVFSAHTDLFKEYKNNAVAGVVYKSKATTDGYKIEASIPWATIGGSGAAATLFGFDLDIVDIDVAAAGSFDAKKMWYGTIDDAYQFPNLLGVARLTGSSVIDTEAPTTPTGLTASLITPTSFTVSWTASTDNSSVAGYEVFNNGVSIGITTLTTFNFTSIPCATANSITVKAKDVAGNASALTSPLVVNTSACDVVAPSAPTGLVSSNITPASFTLTWNAATDNVGVTSYEIFRNGFSAGSTANLTFNLTGLVCETPYTITVKAKDGAGNASVASTALVVTTGICVDATSPSAPTGLIASAITTTGFTLGWTAATDNFGVTGYEIFKDGVSIGTSTATTFNVTGLICQRISLMTVRARDLAGNLSALSTATNVTTASCAVTYEAEDAVRTGGAVATNHPGYSGTGFWTNVTAQGNAVEFTVNAATAGNKDLSVRYANANSARTMTLYVNGVKVKQVSFAATANLNTWAIITDAVAMNVGSNKIKYQFDNGDNGNLNFDYISFNGGAPDIDAPTAPTGLSYTANTATGFTLNWNPSTDNYGVSEYEIFKDGVSAGTSATNTFNLTALTCGFYKMTVSAKDAAGNVSGLSNVFSAVTTPCANANALYVDTNSVSSIQDGSFANPYKSIQQAATVATAGKTVFVRKGLYREEIKMATDGVTYQPFNGEEVTITGTDQLTSWVLQAPGIYRTTMGWNADDANQIFQDGKMLNLVRWPKQTAADVINPSDARADAVTASGNNFIIYDADFNEPATRWVGADIWVNLSHNGADGQGWTGKVIATSTTARTITVNFREPPRLGNIPWGLGDKTQYYLFNPTASGISSSGGIVAILGKGEWYKAGTNLFVRTFNDQAPAATSTAANIVEAKRRSLSFHSSDPENNRSSYTIKDFNFFACAIVTDEKYKTRNIEVVEDAHDIVIDGIKVKYISHFTDQTGNWQSQWSGNTGLVLSGRNNVLKNSTFQYSAGPSICMIGYGNKLLNNTVLDANYNCTNSGAVNTESICQDCEIGYNTISNTTVMAINFKGLVNFNPLHKGVARIHHNKITNALVRGWDSGVIDMVARDGQWTRIDHNVIYNTTIEGKTEPARHGIYLDFGGGTDLYSGRYIVDHNVVYDIAGPMLMNHIKYVNVYNNVFLSGVPTDNAIGNYNGGTGEEDTIRNNIMSNTPNIVCCSFGTLRNAVIENNIMNAQGATAFNIFTDTTTNNYTLKSTAIDAINTGIDFAPFNDPIVGPAVDLGAFEFGGAVWSAGTPDLPSPRIVTNGGEFYDSVTVNIFSDSVGAAFSIRYTIDGSDPTATSPLYSGPIKLTQSASLKARVFAGATRYSASSSASFTIFVLPPGTILRDPENPLYVLPGVIRKYYEYDPALNYSLIPNLSLLTPLRTDTFNLVGLYPAYRPDNFLFQFTGFIDIPTDGIYKFFTTSDDNSTFYIGNQLVVDNNFLQPPTERSGTIGLKKGRHAFRTEFMEGGGGETFIVKFQGPGVTKQNLPATSLYYNNTPSANIAMSPAGGTFVDEVNVTLSSTFAGTTIYYTTNGTEPTLTSTVYSGPINIRNSLTIKAVVYIGSTKGASTSADFIIIPIIGGPRAVIFPNPSEDGRFSIKFKNPGVGQLIGMFIFDARGRSVFQKNIRITTASSTQVEKFNLTFLKPGAYLVRLKTVSSEAGNLMDEEINLIVK